MVKFTEELTFHRAIPNELINLLKSLPRGLRPIDVLRLGIDYLGTMDREASMRGPNDEAKAPEINRGGANDSGHVPWTINWGPHKYVSMSEKS